MVEFRITVLYFPENVNTHYTSDHSAPPPPQKKATIVIMLVLIFHTTYIGH